MVQPKIDPLHEPARDVAVVVLQENDAIFQPGFTAKSVNFLYKRLACFVARMRFACENELYWPRSIIHQSLQSLLVTEQKRAALVSGETARKPDGQCFRVKNPIHLANRLGGFAHSLATLSLPVADKIDQAAFKFLMCLPKLC